MRARLKRRAQAQATIIESSPTRVQRILAPSFKIL